MAVIRLQMIIDSSVYPDLHDLLLPLTGAGRAEKLRFLATAGMMLQRQAFTSGPALQPVVAHEELRLPATAEVSATDGRPTVTGAAASGVAVNAHDAAADPAPGGEHTHHAGRPVEPSAPAPAPQRPGNRASSLARRMSTDLLGGRPMN